MGVSAAVALAAAAVSAGTAVYTANQQVKAQDEANRRQAQLASEQAAASKRASDAAAASESASNTMAAAADDARRQQAVTEGRGEDMGSESLLTGSAGVSNSLLDVNRKKANLKLVA